MADESPWTGRPKAKPDGEGVLLEVSTHCVSEDLTKAEAMALACELIEAATGYVVLHDGDEPTDYLRALPVPRFADMRLYAKDPACEGPPTRHKHDGCGGGLLLSESSDDYTCRKCRVVIDRAECRKRRALGEPGGYAAEVNPEGAQ